MTEQEQYEYNLKYVDDTQVRCQQYRNGEITAKQFADQVAINLWYITAELPQED